VYKLLVTVSAHELI